MLRRLKSAVSYRTRRFARRFFDPTLCSWFYDWLLRQNTLPTWYPHTNTYYEFGVAAGGTMREFLRAVEMYSRHHGVPYTDFRIFGFDSFEGFPEKKDARDDHPEWRKGGMSHPQDAALGKIKAFNFPMSQVELIPGFYEKSLTPALRERLSKTPPSIVTLDCDYYSSTFTVLEWLEPFLPSGAVLYFDDIFSFHLSPNHGQLKAIHDINARGVIHLAPNTMFGLPHQSYICARQDGQGPLRTPPSAS